MYEDEFYESPEDYSEPISEKDSYFLQAQEDIKKLYEKDRESVYYIRQIQVKLEKKYYHWITNNAIIGLYKMGYLKDVRIPREKGTSTRYFIHRSNRYAKRKIRKLETVIEEYSQDHITRSCGHSSIIGSAPVLQTGVRVKPNLLTNRLPLRPFSLFDLSYFY
jgi:hypothetical protein